MAVNINSPEFANAWRTVSEALLAHFQGGSFAAQPPVPQPDIQQPANDATWQPAVVTPPNLPPQTATKEVESVRYAGSPVKQADGSYIFKNMKAERQSESTFKVTKYTDGSCEYELCELEGESRQFFKDNLSYRLPAAVGKFVGEITADNSITTVRKGKGVVDGRSVKITEPLEAKAE